MRPKIAFLGDVFVGGEYLPFRYAEPERRGLSAYVFNDLIPYLFEVDALCLNLEGPIGKEGEPRAGVTARLHNDPEIISFMKLFKNCIANLSNNHIMDFSETALLNTVYLLNKNGIRHLGAGSTLSDAWKPLRVCIGQRKIAVLALTTDDPAVGSVIGGISSAGCAPYDNLSALNCYVSALRKNVDDLIVLLHWGTEYYAYPSPKQVEIAHSLADSGADLVIGHHPHIIQGYEEYRESIIFYSIGNFFLPPIKNDKGRLKPHSRQCREFLIAKVELGENKPYKVELIPGERSRFYKLKVFKDRKRNRFFKRIKILSDPIGTKDYQNFYEAYTQRRERQLTARAFLEAVNKLMTTPITDLIKTVSMQDILRNYTRLFSLFRHKKNS